jgi:hypothetical protein
MTAKIFTIAHVPEHLRHAWLQHLREFDATHKGCHFEVAVDAPDLSMRDVIEMVRLNPKLTFAEVFERKP